MNLWSDHRVSHDTVPPGADRFKGPRKALWQCWCIFQKLYAQIKTFFIIESFFLFAPYQWNVPLLCVGDNTQNWLSNESSVHDCSQKRNFTLHWFCVVGAVCGAKTAACLQQSWSTKPPESHEPVILPDTRIAVQDTNIIWCIHS